MSSMINSNGTWATCSNNSSKQCAGYNSTHGADCYKTASLLLDCYEMTGDSRYLTMAATLYADLDNAAKMYSLSKAGNNFRHTWASDPSPDLWLDGLYMILPFRAEYAKHIGDTEELDLIVSRMQWVSDNMYNSSRRLFYHAADSSTANSGTFWLRSIGWYAAAIVDIMDSMSGSNLEAMKNQLVKLVDGMKACQNTANGMWLNNMAASHSSSNPYETSGTALVCYAVMKAVNNGWLDESYADMAILAFNGICNEKLSGSTLKDICFKGAPGSSNSTFYNNEGKGVGPFIMLYAEMLEYVNNNAHEHSYETVTVEATCTENGSVTTKCTGCGESTVEVIPALGHEYECEETAATCGSDGTKVYTCAKCDDTYTETIPATANHSYASVKVDATCVDAGSITYTCTVCGDSYAERIPATGNHIYKTVTVNATCVDEGSITYTCAFCGDSYSEVIEATGHNYTCVVTEATCTKDGNSVYTCSICDDSYAEAIAATGHDYAGVVTGATCLEGGFTTFTCAHCGDSYVADYTEPLGHSYESATVNATCTEDGSVTYYCACGDIYSEVIPSAGHNYQAVVTEPTCTADGYTTHTCTSCGDSYVTDNIAALGHNNETITVAPTCTVGGYTASSCTVCGEGSVYDETAALGHAYVSETVDPTETEGGYTTHTCGVCGHSYTDNYVDALGHTIVSVVTEPTCLTEGYTTHTCTVCGEVTVDTYVPALGHNYQTVTVDATCTADGSVSGTCTTCADAYNEVIGAYGHNYIPTVTDPSCTEGGHTVYTCDRCGDSYISDFTDALGHNYTTIITNVTCTEDGYTTYLCTNCGDSYTGQTVAATGHSYETVTAEATCTENGTITHTCTACGDSYAEEIPATGHDYQAVVTAPTCTEAGYTTYTCACGQSYTADAVEALGHSYSTEEVNGNLVYTCDHCGDTYTESVGWIAQSGRYVLDQDGIDVGADHRYIVVGSNKNYALTLSDSTIGAAAVSIDSNAITLKDASKYEFYFVNNGSKESGSYLLTQDGTKGVYHMGGNMYYGIDNKGYWHIGSNSNGAYQLYDYDNLNWYLNYGYVWASDSVSRFAVSSNARTVRLFKATDSYVRLSGGVNQTWPHGAQATESAVLEQVLIQTSKNGSTVDTSAAVTSSMVIWDKTFDGYTAGIYTASVYYNGESIGTVTVTITGEHVYEDEVVAATCTQQGYTVHTCTDCGTSYTDSYTDALDHSYTSVETNGYLVYTCGNCGEGYSEKIASAYTKVTSFSSGNNYVITLVSGSKYYALSHSGNRISAVQVKASNGEITSEITEDLVWNYSGSKLSYKNGSTTYYLYASSSNNWWGNWWGSSSATLSLSTSSSSTVSLSSNKVKVGSYYLRYSSSSISLSSSGTTANLFIEE